MNELWAESQEPVAGTGGDYANTFADSAWVESPGPVSIEQTRAEVEHSELEKSNHLGFKDDPLREFRSTRPDEFLEPISRTHPVEAFSPPENLIDKINPDYGDPSGSYDVNCADCARSFERSWRGDFEEAAGRAPDRDQVVDGEPSSETEDWAGEKFSDVYNSDDLRDRLETAGHGASAIVHTDFVGPDGDYRGHAFNVVNDQGVLKVCDAQTHEVGPWTGSAIHPDLDGLWTRHRAMAWNSHGSRVW